MKSKRTEWPVGFIVSVGAHVLLAVVLVTVKVVQYIIEPPAEFKATAPADYTVQPPKQIKQQIKQNQQSGGGGRPPKVAIAVDLPSSFSVPKVDVQISSLTGKLGSRGSGSGIGDGNGQGQGPGSGYGSGGGPGGLGRLGASLFGYSQGLDTDMRGSFWDFKQSPSGKPTGMDTKKYVEEVDKFLRGAWKESELSEYYKADKSLFLTHLAIPNCSAALAPSAYGVQEKVKPMMWIAMYDGFFEAPVSGMYRFVGQGDDVLAVKVGNKVVLDATVNNWKPSGWKGSGDEENRKWKLGPRTAEIGDWFKMDAGTPLPLQIVVGEWPGGSFCQLLGIERKGFKPKREASGRPLWDLFKIDELSEQERKVLEAVSPDQTMALDGPLFKTRTAVKR